MAMTVREKRVFRTALANEKHANVIIGVIDGGSATALADAVEKTIKNAIGNDRVGANIVTALETGSAVSAAGRLAFRKMIGDRNIADDIITQIDALT